MTFRNIAGQKIQYNIHPMIPWNKEINERPEAWHIIYKQEEYVETGEILLSGLWMDMEDSKCYDK